MQQSKRKLEDAEHKENGNEDSGEGGTKLVEEEGGAKLEEEEEVVVEREKSARVLREAKRVCSSRWKGHLLRVVFQQGEYSERDEGCCVYIFFPKLYFFP
jgi:hypothetical protein